MTTKHFFVRNVSLALSFVLYITNTAAQWEWQNPKPSGNDLHGARFINSETGWLCGGNGSIFKTTNGGISWNEQSINPKYDFSCLFALDENHIWASTGNTEGQFAYFSIQFSSDGGLHWNEQLSALQLSQDSLDLRMYSIWDMHFLGDSLGWAIGDSGLLLQTTNSGQNWNLLTKSLNYSFKSIDFISDSFGYLCGERPNTLNSPSPHPLSVSEGVILITTNRGELWDTIYSDTIGIYKARFRSQMLGWALGTSYWINQFTEGNARNYILKTTNGGSTWQTFFVGAGARLEDLTFVDDNNGFAVGPGGEVLVTTDGGDVWSFSNPTQRFISRLYAITFSDSLHGFIAGSDGAILQSFDRGYTWSHYDSKLIEGSIDDIFFVSPFTGWFVQSDLFRTTDGGLSWTASGLSGLRRLYCFNKNNCWAYGYNGQLVFSSDTGNTWTQQNTGTTTTLSTIGFSNPKLGWLGGSGLLTTTNGGASWNPVTTPLSRVDKIVTQDSNRVWIYGGVNSYRTTDGGQNWTHRDPSAIWFINPDTGWAKNSDSLFRTSDGGQSWDFLGLHAVSYLNTEFINGNLGWTNLLTNISATTDGGSSWNVQLAVNPLHTLTNMHFVDSKQGWAAGGSGAILRYCDTAEITSVVPHDNRRESSFELLQNFPNPFNGTTTIRFRVKDRSLISFRIYNILGEEVKTIHESNFSTGEYAFTWDGRNESGLIVPSGVYFYVVRQENFARHSGNSSSYQAKRLLFIK